MIKKLFYLLLLHTLLLVSGNSIHAQTPDNDLNTDLKNLLTKNSKNGRNSRNKKNNNNNITIGCCIYDLTADSTLFEQNADRMMIPASTQKLYTATAMLSTYGEDFTFMTSITTNGEEAMDTLGNIFLKGDIYINTNCDPTLTAEGARAIKDKIIAMGYDSIDGGIILCINEKTQHIRLAEDNFAPQVAKLLASDTVKFSSTLTWGKENTTEKGMYPLGFIRTPLMKVMNRMLKSSDNIYAESMLLNLVKNDDNWSYDGCKDIVRKMVEDICTIYRPDMLSGSISTYYYNIADGSGLSRSNKTTAQSQVDLLRYVYHNKNIFQLLYDNMPIAGVDGTLGHRMTDGMAHNNVHAKTGTLNGVSTLSGYLTAANGHDIAFSILINNCYDKPFARSLQNKLCEVLSKIE